jgi:outer membrane protein
MKRTIITGLFLALNFIKGITQPPPEKIIAFQECLKLAIENNSKLKISQLEQKKLRYQSQETLGKGLPALNFSGSFDDYVNLPTQVIPGEFFNRPGEMVPVQFGTTYNLAGSIEASQLLYNQSFLVALQLSRQLQERNKLEQEKITSDLVFEVGQSFYLTQITHMQINNLTSNLDELTKVEKIARTQYEAGFIKKIDLDRITVNRLNLLTEIERLEVLYQQQLSMQKYFMGLDADQPIAFPDSVSTSGIRPDGPANLPGHIEIRLIEKQKQLAVTNLNLDRAGYYPTLNLIGSTNYMNQTNSYYMFGKSNDWFNASLVGLRLNVPIFNGFQKRAKVSQSRVTLEQIRVSEEDAQKLLQVQVETAHRKLLNSITAEQRQRENQSLAERVYSVSQEQYQKGVIPLTDLLEAEKALNEAMTGHITAMVQMKLSELEYLKANGTILSVLNQ